MVLVFKRFSFLSLFVLSRSMEMETGSQNGQVLAHNESWWRGKMDMISIDLKLGWSLTWPAGT
jgi:hypothetical protein